MAKQQQLTKEQKDARDEARRSDLTQKMIDAVQAIQSSDDFIRHAGMAGPVIPLQRPQYSADPHAAPRNCTGPELHDIGQARPAG